MLLNPPVSRSLPFLNFALLRSQPISDGSIRPGFRAALNLSIFLAVLVAGCSFIHRLLPSRPDVPVVSAKLAWLAAHPDTYDTLFIGTSRVFHGFQPRVFDERMAALGHPSRSFNLGAAALNFPESLFVLDSALARMAKPPKLVIMESGIIYQGPLPSQTDDSLRAVYWHDWRHTRIACESILRSSERRNSRLALLGWNISLFARNCSNIGRGSEQLRLDGRKRSPVAGVLEEGFNRVELAMSPEDRASFATLLARKKLKLELPMRRDPALTAELHALAERLATQGTRLVFVLMPAFRASMPEVPPAPLIDLDDPGRYPEFWLPEGRSDPHHFNAKGAEVFSTLLATEVAAQLK